MNFIAKEGRLFCGVVFIIWLLCWIFWHFSFILSFLLLLLLFIFRQKNLNLECVDKKAIVCPIDGKIISLENAYLKELGECFKIDIKTGILNKGFLGVPFKLDIEKTFIKNGFILNANSNLSENYAQKIIILATSNEHKIALKIKPFCCNLNLNFTKSNLNAGEKISFLLSGCVSLYLPKNTRVLASLNQSLKQGALLGYLN